MIKEAIVALTKKENLTYEAAETSMDEIMSGKATPVQMSAFLIAMAMKGETIEEITACAAGMRKHCVKLLQDQDVLEIVGTGGDRSNSFNISTTSALVEEAVRKFHPYGVDISSGVETDGVKDEQKIEACVRRIRNV